MSGKFAKVSLMNKILVDKNFTDVVGEFSCPLALLVVCNEKEEWFRQQLIKYCQAIAEDIIDIYPDGSSKKKIITIKQSRELIRWLNLKPQGKSKLAFIHQANLINTEAANALLKIIEELPKSSILTLFMTDLNVLDTIKSRCRIIHLTEEAEIANQYSKYIETFLSQSFYKQSKSIDEIVKNEKIGQFLVSLEEWARNEMLAQKSTKNIEQLKKIFKTRKSIMANANAKLALENLVLEFRK